MSGTSADGADVALVATDGENAIEFFGGLTLPFDRELRARVLEASQHDVPLTELARIERDITLHHADAVAELLRTLPLQVKVRLSVCATPLLTRKICAVPVD